MSSCRSLKRGGEILADVAMNIGSHDLALAFGVQRSQTFCPLLDRTVVVQTTETRHVPSSCDFIPSPIQGQSVGTIVPLQLGSSDPSAQGWAIVLPRPRRRWRRIGIGDAGRLEEEMTCGVCHGMLRMHRPCATAELDSAAKQMAPLCHPLVCLLALESVQNSNHRISVSSLVEEPSNQHGGYTSSQYRITVSTTQRDCPGGTAPPDDSLEPRRLARNGHEPARPPRRTGAVP